MDILTHGPSSKTDIVTRTHLHRPEVYRFLPLLIERGLLALSPIGKRVLYVTESPELLLSLVETLESEMRHFLPDLLSLHARGVKRPNLLFRQGRKALEDTFSDVVTTLKKGEIFYRISSEKDVDLANTYLPSDYRIKRDLKELERYVIMGAAEAQKKKPRLEREMVVIPSELGIFEDNVTLFIYAHKVAFIEFTTETSIIIENEFIASFLQKIFTLLYVSLKRNQK